MKTKLSRMRPAAVVGVMLAVASLAIATGPVAAEEVTAEVQTWAGQSWRLARPSLEVFYTILPTSQPGEAGSLPTEATAAPASANPLRAPGFPMSGGPRRGSPSTTSEPKPGHKQTEVVTLSQAGMEIRIPLSSIASLVFFRQPVRPSMLPPYAAASHFRYSATATLVDGSRVEADYVNLGTALVRGKTPWGRVEIPWHEIERIRFERVGTRETAETPALPSSEAPIPKPEEPRKAATTPLNDIFFDFDKYQLRDHAKTALAENAKWLHAHPEVEVMVEGHCDERGTNEYNLALGEQRAKAVRDYLVAIGVGPNRISTISYGEERPFVGGQAESAWKWNRRAHFGVAK